MNASDGLMDSGRWDEALGLILEAQPTARGTSRLYATRQLAQLLALRGDFDGASRALDEISRTFREGVEAQFNGPIAVTRLELAAQTADIANGRHIADQALAVLAQTEDRVVRSDVLRAALQLEASAAELTKASRYAVGERDAIRRGTAHLAAVRLLGEGLKPNPRTDRVRQAIAFAEAEFTRFATSDAARWRAALATTAAHGPAYDTAYATYRLAESLLANRANRDEAG